LLHLEGRTSALAFTPIRGESAEHGWKFVNKVSNMEDKQLAAKLATAFGEQSLKQNPRQTAMRFRETVKQLETNPILASRIALHLEKFEQTGGPPSKEVAANLLHNKNAFRQKLQEEGIKLRERKRASERTLRFKDTPVSLSSLFPDDR
jgi:hypothetical protein